MRPESSSSSADPRLPGPRAREALLRTAREAIAEAVGAPPGPAPDKEALEDLASSGAFVTLTKQGALRGCIGRTQSDQPLPELVREMAVAAATEDPRFPAVRPEELPDIDIEISVLGAPERCRPDAVEVGRHGLVVEGFGRRGLLLPDVAVDWGWDRREFIEGTCRKAGLPKDAIEQGARLYRFVTQRFGERPHRPPR